jgi:hypothetical protein
VGVDLPYTHSIHHGVSFVKRFGKNIFRNIAQKIDSKIVQPAILCEILPLQPSAAGQKPDYKQIGLNGSMGIFQSPFLFGNLSGPDIVPIIIGIQPLCGLITHVGVFLDKPTDVAPGCSGVQTIDFQPTIFNSGDDCVVRLKSNATLDFKDTAISVGMRIKFFHVVHFLSFWMY